MYWVDGRYIKIWYKEERKGKEKKKHTFEFPDTQQFLQLLIELRKSTPFFNQLTCRGGENPKLIKPET